MAAARLDLEAEKEVGAIARKNKASVVIVRKDKKLRKGTHVGLFALTGGLSGVFTGVRAAQIGAYNARTRRLQDGPGRDARSPAVRAGARGGPMSRTGQVPAAGSA